MGFKPALLWCLCAVISQVACQSPGPDWPKCASTSQSRHAGWEVLSLRYQPPEKNSGKALLDLDLQNLADGSRTVCSLLTNGTEKTAILENSDGECQTGWSGKYDSFGSQTMKTSTAEISFDTVTRKLTIKQEWSCRLGNGILIPFTGSGASSFNYSCSTGREGGTYCGPPGLNIITEPPLFVGPAVVASPSFPPPDPASAPEGPSSNCLSGTSSPAGWQILALNYFPPTPQPEDSPYAPTSIRVELRNLVDESRTLCYLETQDISQAGEGIVLHNGGSTLNPQNFANGCSTGWFFEVADGKAAGEKQQEWHWAPTAEVTFNTKTHELSINQTLSCGDEQDSSVIVGYAAQELSLDCEETGNPFYPLSCEPTTALYTTSSAPIVLGPGELTTSDSASG